MTLEAVREVLRSGAPVVVVEAPAGCGKTHEAVSLAIDMARGLPPHQEVLLLAHTNAAVQEFRRRAREHRVPVRASTLDAFALELVAPYANQLGLPTPLSVGDPQGVPFGDLSRKLLELLERAPSIARALASHYPVAIFDEHQDARIDQHRIATALTGTGRTRLRIFGDPMQAIYGFGEEQLVDWGGLCADTSCVHRLDSPRRWMDSPELGEWIMSARTALEDGGRLPLESAPAGVRIHRLPDLQDMPNPNSDKVTPPLIHPLRELINHTIGSIAVVAISNRHVLGLRRTVSRRLAIQEGADIERANEFLARAETCVGQGRDLALAVVDLLSETSTGMTKALRARLERCCCHDYLDARRQHGLLGFLGLLEKLYERPDLRTWCKVVGQVGQHPPLNVNIDYPDVFRVLGQLLPADGEDSRSRLDAALRYRREVAVAPYRCVSTIHKVKGQEFDHVVIAHCSRSPFPDTPYHRRLLYVALSRARLSVTILASRDSPSPLLGIS